MGLPASPARGVGHLFRAAAVVCVLPAATSAAGCKGWRGGSGAPDAAPSADARAATSDASADGAPSPSASVSASAIDGGAPADDTIPATSSDELTARARHLLEGISKDDPDLAVDIEFPRAGWIGLRDVDDPGLDWDKHVDRTFRHAVHVLSRHTEGAQFISLELGHAVVQVGVKRHGWKKALWSVHGSRLTYLVDGHTRTLVIHEMIAWRGAWYVTHLR